MRALQRWRRAFSLFQNMLLGGAFGGSDGRAGLVCHCLSLHPLFFEPETKRPGVQLEAVELDSALSQWVLLSGTRLGRGIYIYFVYIYVFHWYRGYAGLILGSGSIRYYSSFSSWVLVLGSVNAFAWREKRLFRFPFFVLFFLGLCRSDQRWSERKQQHEQQFQYMEVETEVGIPAEGTITGDHSK